MVTPSPLYLRSPGICTQVVRRIAIVVINIIFNLQVDLIIILVLDLVCPSHALFASCHMEHSVHLEVVNF